MALVRSNQQNNIPLAGHPVIVIIARHTKGDGRKMNAEPVRGFCLVIGSDKDFIQRCYIWEWRVAPIAFYHPVLLPFQPYTNGIPIILPS